MDDETCCPFDAESLQSLFAPTVEIPAALLLAAVCCGGGAGSRPTPCCAPGGFVDRCC